MTKRRHFGNVRKLPSGRYQAAYWHEGRRHTAPMTFAAKAVDVAQELGELALEVGDFPAVYWAVDKGLSLEPTREELFRLWMHALGREGRPAKVDDVYRRLKLVLRQRIHPLQEPQRESWEVWRSYTAVESFAAGRPGEW